jgi:acyl-CoA synthetase (AMP-forming)/AMP-acid ligase II
VSWTSNRAGSRPACERLGIPLYLVSMGGGSLPDDAQPVSALLRPGDVLDVLERDRCTVIGGVPTMLHALAQQDITARDLSALRVAVSGGASLPEDVLRTFEGKYGIEVLEGYGMSETASSCTSNRPGDRRVLSIGKPLWGVTMRVADSADRPRLGEEVVAVVVLHPGSELSADELIAYCRERLAAYKYPREIRFVAELPKGPSGKVLKSSVREAVA